MEGKLIKTSKDSYHNGHYFLNDGDGFAIGSSDKDWCKRAVKKRPLYVLSLSNCQAIERGYDLDELARQEAEKIHIKSSHEDWDVWECLVREEAHSIKIGMVKMLELMGDKKFTEEDVRIGMDRVWSWCNGGIYQECTLMSYVKDKHIQSLQQTEWEVEIEMICPHPEDTYVCGIQYGCDEDGCNHPNKIPLLDADGYLILKQKL